MAGYIGAQHLPDVYTKNEIDAGDAVLEAVKRVDGQGSGLDADKIHGKTGSDLNAELSSLNVKSGVMTKAEFEALAAQRREEFAGSGFVEWGRHYDFNTYTPINQGLYTRSLWPNLLALGNNDHYAHGNSTTGYPLLNINGVIHNISQVYSTSSNITNYVLLSEPNLPTVETDSSNLSKDYKQGDNILLNDTGIELVSNSTFDASGRVASYTYTNGDSSITIEDDTSTSSGYVRTRLHLIPGAKYHLSFKSDKTADAWDGHRNFIQNSTTGDVHGTNFNTLDTQEFIFTATQGTCLVLYASDDTFTYSELSVKQLPSQKLTVIQDISAGTDVYADPSKFMGVDSFSRQDLVFLECDDYTTNNVHNITISDKVYPYGNRQYIGNGIEGINSTLYDNEQDDDTLFGSWKNEVIGKHYKWSELSESDKINLASDPDSNVYLDENEFKQVTYAIRCNKGYGNNWTYDFTSDKNTLGLVKNISNNGIVVNSSTNSVLLVNVQRRNQGIYHPVYNQEGCAKVNDDGEAKFWYESSLINSVEDCFKPSLILGGTIASGTSGRPDGLFADEINERDVEDLRMDAHKVTDYKGYLEQKFNDTVAGKIRGKERNVKTVIKKFQITSSGGNWIGNNFGYGANAQPEWNALGAGNNSNWGYKGGSAFTDPKITAYVKTPEKIYTLDVKKYPDMEVSNTSNGRTEFRNITIDLTNAEWVVVVTHLEESYENNNTVLVCDIIGDLRKIQDRVKYTGGIHSLVKGDYVKHGDNYYLSLANRSDVDLDNDDYGDTGNWTDLGTDGTVGGYPQEWLDNGVFGTPLLVGENGDITLLPKSHESYKGGYRLKLSRKYKNESYRLSKVLVTLNGETTELPLVVNYTRIISDGDLVGYYYNKSDNTIHFNLTGTGGYDTDIEENAIIQVFYESKSNIAEVCRNTYVLSVSSNGWAGNHYGNDDGVYLYNSLINKVPTGHSSVSIHRSMRFTLSTIGMNSDKLLNSSNYYGQITDTNDMLFSNSPSALKTFPYLTSTNNRAQMNLVFKEMKYDNAAINQDGSPTDTWGDDNKFQIRDGVSVLTDDNGNTVLYGQKAIKLDRFITED